MGNSCRDWCIGVLGELIVLPRGLSEAAELKTQSDRLEATNLVLRSNVVALEMQLEKTKAAITNLNPLKQPITSVSAFVQFRTLNTKAVELSQGWADQLGLAHLSMGRAENTATNLYAISLVAYRYSQWSGGESLWSMQFSMDPLGPRYNLTSELAEQVFLWNSFALSTDFIQPFTNNILGGEASILINGVVRREFKIPAMPMWPGAWIDLGSNRFDIKRVKREWR